MNKEKNSRFFSPSIFPKSRKADVATLVLVIGVFLVCAITIVSLTISLTSVNNDFNVLQNMVSINSVAEQIRFFENIGINPADVLDISQENNQYVIISERQSDDVAISWGLEKEKRAFYVKYKIPVKTS